MEKQITTRNGVDIFSYSNPHMHQTCLWLYLRYGSMYEPKDYNGLAHFFEHILFRNLNKLYNGEFYRLLDRNYVDFNATTYNEMMIFQIRFPTCKTDFVLEFFEKIFSPIVLDAKEISIERGRIRAEIRDERELGADMRQLTQNAIWAGTQLSKPTPGTFSSVAKIHKKQLDEARQEIFSAHNLFVYLTGNVPDDLPNKIGSILERQNFSKNVPFRGNLAPIPQSFQHRNCTVLTRKAEYSYMKLCFDVDCVQTTKAERDLLYNILFSGDFCKFYQHLSEETGLIYGHDAVMEEYRNIGNLRVRLDYDEKDFLQLLREVVAIFKEVKRGDFDLECARTSYTLGAELLLDNASGLNWSLAYESKILQVPYTLEESVQVYDSVTPQRIAQLAAEIFTTENLVFAVKGNVSAKQLHTAREILEELDVK